MTITTATRSISEDDEEVVELIRLTNINVVATGLVDHAANRAEFFALKRAGSQKQAPTDGMSNEELRAAREARSEEYGIEILEDAALTFPADYPTSLDEYADPCNLAYPIDTPERAQNARVRFKQYADETYSKDESKAVVHERIVRAELAMGVVPSYDPDDKLDALLPADLKDEMEQAAQAEARSEKMDPKAQMQEILAAMTVGEPLTEEQMTQLEAAVEAFGVEPVEPAEAAAEGEPGQMAEGDGEGGEGETEAEVVSPEEMAEKAERSARERARELLWSVMDDIDNGAVDTEEEKELRAQILVAIREAVAQKMEMSPEELAEAQKSGRPQLSKARVAKLKEAFDSLKAMLDEIGALAESATELETASQKSDQSAMLEEVKAQLAAKAEEVSQKSAEIAKLKTAAEAAAQRAAPPATFGIEGAPSPKPESSKKKRNPLDLQIRGDE